MMSLLVYLLKVSLSNEFDLVCRTLNTQVSKGGVTDELRVGI